MIRYYLNEIGSDPLKYFNDKKNVIFRERFIKKWGVVLEDLLKPVKPNDELIILFGCHFEKLTPTDEEYMKSIEIFRDLLIELKNNPENDQIILYYSFFNLPELRKIKIKKLINNEN